MNESRAFLIITGMHRSGTSLAASLLGRAGLELGENLNPAAEDNPHGYFEDMDVVQFHQALLQARGLTIFAEQAYDPTPTDKELAQAHTLAAKFYAAGIRGWKDPRAALFLDLWTAVLPNAGYLFVYRSPLDVLLSLMRRRNGNMAGLLEGLDAWTLHNARLLDFYARHAADSVLCSTQALVSQPGTFLKLLARKLDLPLTYDPAAFADLYFENELHHRELTPPILDALAVSHPEALRVYGELEQRADIPNPDLAVRINAALAKAPELPHARRRAVLLDLCAQLEPETVEAFYAVPSATTLLEATRYIASLKETLDATRERLQESIAYTQSLENALVQALLQASTSKTYVASLEDTLNQTRAHRAEGEQYARSLLETLEQTRAQRAAAEEHALSLQSTLEQTRAYLQESERYARSLEQEIEKLRVPLKSG